MKTFLYSSLYSCHLFLISSASVRSLLFLSFIVLIFAWNVPLVSFIFLKRYLVFPILFFPLFLCLVHLRRLSYLSLLFFGTLCSVVYIFPSLVSLPFSAICKASPDNHCAFLCFFFFGIFWTSPPGQCLQTSIHSSSGTLSTYLIPWIYLLLSLHTPKQHKKFLKCSIESTGY